MKVEKLLLQNPNHRHKQGLLSQIEIKLNVPLGENLWRNFANYELWVQAQDGVLNLNKKFLMSFMTFFIYLDALVTVLKSIEKLVQKQHYQDTLMYNTMLKYK